MPTEKKVIKKKEISSEAPAPKKAELKIVESKEETVSPEPVAKVKEEKTEAKVKIGIKKKEKVNKIKVGGQTSRKTLEVMFLEELKKQKIESIESLTDASKVVEILETLIVKITSVSRLAFAGSMFRLRHHDARLFKVPTKKDIYALVPEHYKVLYMRYADDTTPMQGRVSEDGTMFIPEGEDESSGMLLSKLLNEGETTLPKRKDIQFDF
jgi:hypothetical protein